MSSLLANPVTRYIRFTLQRKGTQSSIKTPGIALLSCSSASGDTAVSSKIIPRRSARPMSCFIPLSVTCVLLRSSIRRFFRLFRYCKRSVDVDSADYRSPSDGVFFRQSVSRSMAIGLPSGRHTI